MIKKRFKDNLFPYLNWIFKKTQQPQDDPPPVYIVNRWVSMADKDCAKIVNATLNRWINKTQFFRENELIGKFYKSVLPYNNKKINYIKKNSEEQNKEQETELEMLSSSLEISTRELNLYNSILEDLNLSVNKNYD